MDVDDDDDGDVDDADDDRYCFPSIVVIQLSGRTEGGRLFGASDRSPHKNDRNSETTKRKRDPKVSRMGKGLI